MRYPSAEGIGFLHMLALAIIGLVVIATTRARLGMPARPALQAEAAVAAARA